MPITGYVPRVEIDMCAESTVMPRYRIAPHHLHRKSLLTCPPTKGISPLDGQTKEPPVQVPGRLRPATRWRPNDVKGPRA